MLDGVRFAVLGLGDSRTVGASWRVTSWATAKDCNQAAQLMERWLRQLGGERFCSRGEADDRTGNCEIGPWVGRMWDAIGASAASA